jgi:hypothetical protein
MLLCRPLLQSPAWRLPPSSRPPPPLTPLLLLVLALLVANTGTQPLKLQPLYSSSHTTAPEALLQRGQHGNVSVSFIKPANGSVVPLSSSSSSSDHEAQVIVQLQILNMWFEGVPPTRPRASTEPSSGCKQAPALCACGSRSAALLFANETSNPLQPVQCDSSFSIMLQQVPPPPPPPFINCVNMWRQTFSEFLFPLKAGWPLPSHHSCVAYVVDEQVAAVLVDIMLI